MTAHAHFPPNHLQIEHLTPCRLNEREASAHQIAMHLRELLDKHGEGHPTALGLPSCIELAVFYNCSPLDVMDALFSLQEEQFAYRMNGLDGKITLQDPIGRNRQCSGVCSWATGQHHEPKQHATEHPHLCKRNPLTNIFKKDQ